MTSLLLALALLGADPCLDAPPACRAAAADAILTWRTTARLCEAQRQALETRLAARTATVTAALVPVPLAAPEPAPRPWADLALAGAAGLVLGAVSAAFLVISAR